MAKQISIPGCTWGVGEGEMQNPETGETTPTRVLVLQDQSNGDQYLFPMLVEDGKRLGQTLAADDPNAEVAKMKAKDEADLQIATRMPSEEELQKVKDIQDGLK
jgi:hypothetical protein